MEELADLCADVARDESDRVRSLVATENGCSVHTMFMARAAVAYVRATPMRESTIGVIGYVSHGCVCDFVSHIVRFGAVVIDISMREAYTIRIDGACDSADKIVAAVCTAKSHVASLGIAVGTQKAKIVFGRLDRTCETPPPGCDFVIHRAFCQNSLPFEDDIPGAKHALRVGGWGPDMRCGRYGEAHPWCEPPRTSIREATGVKRARDEEDGSKS